LQSATKYRVYRFGGRELLSVPRDAPALRAAAVSALPAATPRARLFRLALRGLVAGRLDGLVARRHDGPSPRLAGLDWRAFVGALERALGRDDLEPVVAQPRQASRGRLYVHLFAPDGERIAFAKVATDPGNDPHIAREATVLGSLLRSGAETFRFPSLLDAGRFEGRPYVLLAPLPAGSRPLAPRWTLDLARIRDEIAGAPRTLPSIAAASWWSDFERSGAGLAGLRAELATPGPVEVRGAHGDFVNWNIHAYAGEHWVFDWEAYCPDAPTLVDEVRFALGLRTRAIDEDPGRVAPALVLEFAGRDPARRVELARALAFLHARGVAAAAAVASAWGSRP
jgi:hypothetical protein